MEILVSFRGKPITVADVGRATAVASLKRKLEELTAVPVANQKLICKGKALRDDNDTLESAGVLVRVQQSPPTAAPGNREQGDGTFAQKSKLMLVGSKPSEVTAVLQAADRVTVRNDFDGVVVPKGYKRVALNRPPGASDSSPYRFERIETLPGLPEEDTARRILESLAADPGVRAVLEKHKWTVGALCELYPEGKVGISDTCVMRLNQNHGMKILLRLRTDDLQGFRKILSIRKVLFHELAHNEFSDHDDNFYMLMRQVEKEAAELNWTQQSGGRTLAGRQSGLRAEPAGVPGGGGGFVLVKEAFEGGSGRLGGDSNALTHLFSARELAGQAAVQRLTPEEQEVEDCCGHTKSNKDAISAATAATPAATNTAAVEGPPSDAVAAAGASGAPGEASPSSRMGHSTAETGVKAAEERSSAEVTMESLVSEMSVTSPGDVDAAPSVAAAHADGGNGGVGIGDSDPDARSDRVQDGNAVAKTSDAMDVADDAADEAPAQQKVDKPPCPSEMDEDEPSASAPAPLSPPPSSSSSSPLSPPSPEPAEATVSPQPPTPSLASTPLDELLAMGFPKEASMEALAAAGGSIPDAAYRLLNPGMGASDGSNANGGDAGSTVAAAVTAGAGSGGNQMVGRDNAGGEMRLPRDVRLQQAADRIGRNGDRARAVQCLDVLAAVFRNIMEHPEEAKFRKVRRSNGRFRASVGAVAGGVELLLAAGFEERDGGDQLELGRQDPGLIWLAKSTVEAWQERLPPTGAP